MKKQSPRTSFTPHLKTHNLSGSSAKVPWRSFAGLLMALLITLLMTLLLVSCGGGGGDDLNNQTNGIDRDGDGFDRSQDCDDNDPDIFPGVSRDCSSQCDHGERTCLLSGEWTDCSARSDCACEVPGDTRIVDCGSCGETSQECGLDLIWSYPGTCVGEGECKAGELEEEPCEFCGVRSRLCGSECTWQPWDSSGCFGECTLGDEDYLYSDCELGQRLPVVCGPDCMWNPQGDCTGACEGTPRTGTTSFADEVCIEGGLFFMGADEDEGYSDERPEHIVALTPFFIDVHEVTVARYRACVLAGACTEPSYSSFGGKYFDSDGDPYPVANVTWEQARDYCAWDGNRLLPTEAQWEKAARGPFPIDVRNPWGDETAVCGMVASGSCGDNDPFPMGDPTVDVSYYGVKHMGGNLIEWVRDWAGEYVDSPTPPVNPSFFPPDGVHYQRGNAYVWGIGGHQDTVTLRRSESDTYVSMGFRCARPGL